MEEDGASPGTFLRISGEALLQTFSPFSQGTPGPTTTGEEDFNCSQVPSALVLGAHPLEAGQSTGQIVPLHRSSCYLIAFFEISKLRMAANLCKLDS